MSTMPVWDAPARTAWPAQPPVVIPPPVATQPPVQIRRKPVRKNTKSNSGCGCLLALLLLVGGVVVLGRLGGSKPTPAGMQGMTTARPAHAQSLPSRPMDVFRPDASGHRVDASLEGCAVERIVSGGMPQYRLSAWVNPGNRSNVRVAAYFVDSFGYSVRAMSQASANRDGTLCSGTWIDFPTPQASSYLPQKARVEMNVPVSAARTPPATVQFSLFDDQDVELARWNVAVLPANTGFDQRTRAPAR